MSKEELEEYRERAEKQVDVSDLMTYVIKYMMDKGIKLDNTEGMIEASVFPVNYFTIKQVRCTGPTCAQCATCPPPSSGHRLILLEHRWTYAINWSNMWSPNRRQASHVSPSVNAESTHDVGLM